MNVRPFEWLFLWLQERPVFKATAQLCTFGHPMIFWLGDPLPTMPLHVDVKLEVFKRRGGKVSIYELVHAEAKAQELEALGTFRDRAGGRCAAGNSVDHSRTQRGRARGGCW